VKPGRLPPSRLIIASSAGRLSVVAAQVDGHGVLGDVDGDGLPGVDAAKALLCPTTVITPVLLARRWTVTGSDDGRGGGPAARALLGRWAVNVFPLGGTTRPDHRAAVLGPRRVCGGARGGSLAA
jgi:hypothetical protein